VEARCQAYHRRSRQPTHERDSRLCA
jgi:hypothetical protein